MGKRLLACMLLGLTLAGGGAAAAGPVIEKARGGTCVDVPEVMRRMHPDLLKHQRDETVHRGVRDARASLKGCVDCHAGAQSGSVATAKTDFCVSCHSFAAVKVDCFQCHASRPKQAMGLHPLVDPHAGAGAARLAALWRDLAAGGMTLR
ncbi:MAG TPA: hypothetical protein PL196_06015 [Burkholderiaceae bacterium]|nr:hypothetical protein [Burkholderiaceae bacterium]